MGMFESNRRMKGAFEDASRRLRVPLVAPTRLKGEIDGRRVIFAFDAFDVATTYCHVGYAQSALKAKLLIRRRNPWLPQWRASSITTGDQAFDTLMFVKSRRPEALLQILDHQLRRKILDLSFDGKLTINDKAIGLSWRTPPVNSYEITEPILSLIDVASRLEHLLETPASRPEPPSPHQAHDDFQRSKRRQKKKPPPPRA